MPFAIGEQPIPGFGHRNVMAHGGDGVLQGAPAAGVHMHIAGRHGWNFQVAGQILQVSQALRVVRPAMQFDGQPQPLRKGVAQPTGLLAFSAVIRHFIRHPEGEEPRHRRAEVFVQQQVFALLRSPARLGDQFAERLVALEVLYQQHDLGPLVNLHLTADDQRQLALLRGLPGPDNAGQGALVGDGQLTVAMGLGAPEQLLGAGGAALEAEIRQAVQFGIVHAHANQPCKCSGPLSPTSR